MRTKLWWEYLFPEEPPEINFPEVTVGEPLKNVRQDGRWDYRPLGRKDGNHSAVSRQINGITE